MSSYEKKKIYEQIEKIVEQSTDQEQIGLYIQGDNYYLAIQAVDDGYDYTLFTENYMEIDGGQLDEPDMEMEQAIYMVITTYCHHITNLIMDDYDTILEESDSVFLQEIGK